MESVFICTLPRTGSSLLAADMRSTGALGNPREYFNTPRRKSLLAEWGLPPDDMEAYVEALRTNTTTPNGVFAVKLMATHFGLLKRDGLLEGDSGLMKELAGHFGSVHVVQLNRRDKLRQAISLSKARQTGSWGAGKEPEKEAVYDREAIADIIVQISKWESQWNREFEASGIYPELELDYEDLPDNRENTVQEVANLVGVADVDTSATEADQAKLVRQSDEMTELWVDRFINE